MSSNIRIQKICQFCKKMFIAKTISTRYCSHSCNSKSYKQGKLSKKLEFAKRVVEINYRGKLHDVFDFSAIQNKELLTIKETCALLNITHVTLRRWLKIGLIKSSRIGKKHLIKRSHLDRLTA
jgi:excisionase family DNA binding protein